MKDLTEEEITEYREAFSVFDKNGDGTITSKELGTVLRSMGKFPSPAELEEMMLQVDNDGSGTIDFPEFLSMMAHNKNNRDQKAEVHDSFRAIDKNGDGFITVSELVQVMNNIEEKVSYDDIQEMIKVADLDGDGKVNFDEFYKVVTSN